VVSIQRYGRHPLFALMLWHGKRFAATPKREMR
jgi:hypothetical protein